MGPRSKKKQLKARDAEALVRYLERNDFKMWASSNKASAWDALKTAKLTQEQRYRLRRVAIQYLYFPIGSEFSHMGKFMRIISDGSFRVQVKHLTNAKVFELNQRARLLLTYINDPEHADQANRELLETGSCHKRRRWYW